MLCALSLLTAACQSSGSGTSHVTCQTIDYVYPSRKDTRPTIQAVQLNNTALKALGCPQGTRPVLSGAVRVR